MAQAGSGGPATGDRSVDSRAAGRPSYAHTSRRAGRGLTRRIESARVQARRDKPRFYYCSLASRYPYCCVRARGPLAPRGRKGPALPLASDLSSRLPHFGSPGWRPAGPSVLVGIHHDLVFLMLRAPLCGRSGMAMAWTFACTVHRCMCMHALSMAGRRVVVLGIGWLVGRLRWWCMHPSIIIHAVP